MAFSPALRLFGMCVAYVVHHTCTMPAVEYRSAHVCRILIGACNPMPCPILCDGLCCGQCCDSAVTVLCCDCAVTDWCLRSNTVPASPLDAVSFRFFDSWYREAIGPMTNLSSLGIAGLSGALSAVIVTPVELTMISQQRFGGSVADTIKEIRKAKGWTGLQRGFSSTMLRETGWTFVRQLRQHFGPFLRITQLYTPQWEVLYLVPMLVRY